MENSCFIPFHPNPIPSFLASPKSIFSSSKEVLHKWKIHAFHPNPIPSLSASPQSIFSSSKEVLHKWKIPALYHFIPTQYPLYQHPLNPYLVPQKRFFINGKFLLYTLLSQPKTLLISIP